MIDLIDNKIKIFMFDIIINYIRYSIRIEFSFSTTIQLDS